MFFKKNHLEVKVKAVPKLDAQGTILKVVYKGKECGFVKFSQLKITCQYSCGWFNFYKGLSLRENVELIFKNGLLSLKNKESGKKIWEFNCDAKVYLFVVEKEHVAVS